MVKAMGSVGMVTWLQYTLSISHLLNKSECLCYFPATSFSYILNSSATISLSPMSFAKP